jgi:hypothetical protein
MACPLYRVPSISNMLTWSLDKQSKMADAATLHCYDYVDHGCISRLTLDEKGGATIIGNVAYIAR